MAADMNRRGRSMRFREIEYQPAHKKDLWDWHTELVNLAGEPAAKAFGLELSGLEYDAKCAAYSAHIEQIKKEQA